MSWFWPTTNNSHICGNNDDFSDDFILGPFPDFGILESLGLESILRDIGGNGKPLPDLTIDLDNYQDFLSLDELGIELRPGSVMDRFSPA